MIPLLVDLSGRRVVVVGGGAVSRRKAEQALAAGAVVTVIASEVRSELPPGVSIEHRPYRRGDLEGAWLVVSATDDSAVNDEIAAEAAERRVLCNVVDDPGRSTVFFPAVLREGPVTVAVSTAGFSPTLAGWVRDRIKASLPTGLAEVASTLRAEREALLRQGLSTERRPWRERIEQLLRERVES